MLKVSLNKMLRVIFQTEQVIIKIRPAYILEDKVSYSHTKAHAPFSLCQTHLEYLTHRHTHNQDDMMRQESYQLVTLRRPKEADPQCACLKSVSLSATRQRSDCLVSGQGLSWSPDSL